MLQFAVFLDRDGVINTNHGHVNKRENFDLIDGIYDVARYTPQQDYKLVVITNQAGTTLGYYTKDDFRQLTVWMCEQFYAAGVPIERVYFSPCQPTAGISQHQKDNFSRKPHPRMIPQARAELDLDLVNSALIGYKDGDIQAGIVGGVDMDLLFAPQRLDELDGLAHHTITTLREALPYLAGSVATRGLE